MTMTKLKCAATAALLAIAGSSAQAADVLLEEGFDNVAGLASSWFFFNLSKASPGWFQGGTDFEAQAGNADAYIATSVLAGGSTPAGEPAAPVVYTFLGAPDVSLETATQLSFWTRTITGSQFPDTLSVGVTIDNTDQYLSAVNANLDVGVYPESWTQYTVNLGAQPGKMGSFFFEYYIDPTSTYGNYVGVDTVTITAVPEPGTWLLMGLGVAALGGLRRRSAV